MRGPVAQARCGHGEGESGVLVLPTLRHEFPDRLQYHDYLPGELLPPAPGPSSLFCESSRGFGDADLARGLALLFRGLGPPHRFSEFGEGVGFAASGSLALVVGRRPAAVRAPTQPPSPRFLVHFWRELGGFGAPSRCREKGAVPKAPRSFWTALLTHGSGKSVVPGAECAASQSEPASGDTWGPCWLLSNPESGFGGICRGQLRDLKSTVEGFVCAPTPHRLILFLLHTLFGSFPDAPFLPIGHLHSYNQQT